MTQTVIAAARNAVASMGPEIISQSPFIPYIGMILIYGLHLELGFPDVTDLSDTANIAHKAFNGAADRSPDVT